MSRIASSTGQERYLPAEQSPGGHSHPGVSARPRGPAPAEDPPDERHVPERRKVLITGGSSGIGAATAEEFAARGFLVAVTGRDSRALDHVARLTGGVSIPGDLRERERRGEGRGFQVRPAQRHVQTAVGGESLQNRLTKRAVRRVTTRALV